MFRNRIFVLLVTRIARIIVLIARIIILITRIIVLIFHIIVLNVLVAIMTQEAGIGAQAAIDRGRSQAAERASIGERVVGLTRGVQAAQLAGVGIPQGAAARSQAVQQGEAGIGGGIARNQVAQQVGAEGGGIAREDGVQT